MSYPLYSLFGYANGEGTCLLAFILIDNPGGIVDRIDPALEYLVRDDFPTPFIMRSMGSPSSQSIV